MKLVRTFIITLRYWFVVAPLTAIRDVFSTLNHWKPTLALFAVSMIVGTLSYIQIEGVDWNKAQQQLLVVLAFQVAPAIAYVFLRFLAALIYAPAELYERFVLHEGFREFELRSMQLHSDGTQLLQKIKESDWSDASTLITNRDSWVEEVRSTLLELCHGEKNAFVFKFDDLTIGGLDQILDVRDRVIDEGTSSSFFNPEGRSPQQRAVISDVSKRLHNLHEIAFNFGKLAMKQKTP